MKNIIITVFLATLILSGCSDSKKTSNHDTKNDATQGIKVLPKQTTIKNDKNKFLLKTINEGTIEVVSKKNGFIFKGYEGKVVLLNFFTTWCPPCKAEIPHLNNLQNKYKNQIKIISVLLEDNKTDEDIMRFINKFNVQFTITNSPSNFDLADKLGGVESIPFMVIYDKNGTYSQDYVGATLEEMIDADIQKVL